MSVIPINDLLHASENNENINSPSKIGIYMKVPIFETNIYANVGLCKVVLKPTKKSEYTVSEK
jgi:hypothetical protein